MHKCKVHIKKKEKVPDKGKVNIMHSFNAESW